MALLVAAIFSVGLLIKSILDFTRTGPELAEEVLAHYRALPRVLACETVGFRVPDHRVHGVRRGRRLCGRTAAARRKLSACGGCRRGGRERCAADRSPVRAHVAVLPRRHRGLLSVFHDAFLPALGPAYALAACEASTSACSLLGAAWLAAGLAATGARRRMVGHVAPCRHYGALRGDLLVGHQGTGAGSGPARPRPDSAPEHPDDRLRYVARRPDLRSRLSPGAHAQSGAPREARHAIHRLLRPLCADRAQPRLDAERHLAAHATACATPS